MLTGQPLYAGEKLRGLRVLRRKLAKKKMLVTLDAIQETFWDSEVGAKLSDDTAKAFAE